LKTINNAKNFHPKQKQTTKQRKRANKEKVKSANCQPMPFGFLFVA